MYFLASGDKYPLSSVLIPTVNCKCRVSSTKILVQKLVSSTLLYVDTENPFIDRVPRQSLPTNFGVFGPYLDTIIY